MYAKNYGKKIFTISTLRKKKNVYLNLWTALLLETVHEISNNVVCATSKVSDQPAHMRSLIRAFAHRLSIL